MPGIFLYLAALCVFLCPPRLCAQTESASAPVEKPAAPGSERFDFADGLYARGMYDMASAEYEKLIREYPLHPRTADARFRLAESLFLQQKYGESAAQFQKALELFPDHAHAGHASLRAAEILYQTGQKTEALEKFKALAAEGSGPSANSARYFAGKILMEENKPSEARPYFSALALAPVETPYREVAGYQLGKIALEEGRPGEALKIFSGIENTQQKDLASLVLFGMGQAHYQAGSYEKAAEYFSRAHESAGLAEVRDEAYLNYLKSLYEMKKYGELTESFEKSSFAAPEKLFGFRFLGANSYFQEKRYADALKVYDEILAMPGLEAQDREAAELGKLETLLAQKNTEAAYSAALAMNRERTYLPDRFAYLFAESMKQSGRTREAIEELGRLIERYPDSAFLPQAKLNLAYLLLETEGAAPARAALDDFLLSFPEHPLAMQTLMNRISLDARLNDWAAAVQSSRAFLERYGDTPQAEEVLFQLGSFYLKQDRFAEAVETYGNFLEKYPDSAKTGEARFFLGYAHQLAEDFGKAVEQYGMVAESSVSRDIYYASLKNLAYGRVRLEQLDEAAGAYTRLIQEFPENDLSPEVYFWLADYYLNQDKGRPILETLSALEKKNPEAASRPGFHYYKAEGLRLEGRPEEAVAFYNRETALAEDFAAEALIGKGAALAAAGRNGEALPVLEEAVEAAADNHRLALKARMKTADVYLQMGKPLEAAKGYMAAGILYEDPETVPGALLSAGQAFSKASRAAEAKKAYEELMQRFPDSAEAAQAKGEIKNLNP